MYRQSFLQIFAYMLFLVKNFFHVWQIVIQSISPFFPVAMRDGGVLLFVNFFFFAGDYTSNPPSRMNFLEIRT